MKKIFFTIFALLFASFTHAQDVRPEVEARLSPGNKPTQRIFPGEKSVEIIRIWLSGKDHPGDGITLKKLKFFHEGSDRDQFLRYHLIQGNKTLGKVSLVDSDFIEFSNLNAWIADGKTTELRILGDISTGNIAGDHWFSIPHPDFITVEKEDIRDPETWITGDFPIQANKILISRNFERPSPDCNLREEPVCGADGKSYYNVCIPFQKGIEIIHEGSCTQQSFPKIDPCPEHFTPVCGDNGKTYQNQCFLDLKDDIMKKHDGECFPADFHYPRNFLRAVELFDLKKNELEKLRPRITGDAQERLERISFLLHQYNFTFSSRQNLIPDINDFLVFTENPSDRTRLEQEIEILNASIIDARVGSAEYKYNKGQIPFLDTDEDSWFLESVLFLKNRGWITGYIDEDGNETGLFRPDNFVTKAEITKMFFDAAGIRYDITPDSLNPYAEGHWAYGVIAIAEEMGLDIWSDFPNPDKKADRDETIRLMFQIFGTNIPTHFSKSPFTDIPENNPYLDEIQYARNLKIISGYPDGTFQPENSILRAEAAKIVMNAYQKLK